MSAEQAPRGVRAVRGRRRGVPSDDPAPRRRCRLDRGRPSPRLRAAPRRREGNARHELPRGHDDRARSSARPAPGQRVGRDRPAVRRDAPPARARPVVALPVRDNSYSGATTVLLQAMALAKPIVVTRTAAIAAGYGLVDGDNVRLVAPGDGASFGSALTDLLRERARASARSRARATAESELSWERYVDRIGTALLACGGRPVPSIARLGLSSAPVRAQMDRRRRGRATLRMRSRARSGRASPCERSGRLPQRRSEDAGRGSLLRGDNRERGNPLLLHVRGGALGRRLAGPFLLDGIWFGLAAVGAALLVCELRAPRSAVIASFLVYPLALSSGWYVAGETVLGALAVAPFAPWLWLRGRICGVRRRTRRRGASQAQPGCGGRRADCGDRDPRGSGASSVGRMCSCSRRAGRGARRGGGRARAARRVARPYLELVDYNVYYSSALLESDGFFGRATEHLDVVAAYFESGRWQRPAAVLVLVAFSVAAVYVARAAKGSRVRLLAPSWPPSPSFSRSRHSR